MTDLPETIELTPHEEARRLWAGGTTARAKAAADLAALFESLDFGLRAAEILAGQKLQPVREDFPATIGVLLESPDPAVDVHRDAVAGARSLSFTEIVDLLSEEELPCVAPGLHRGWEDRTFSCRRSRKTARRAVGESLTESTRERLLLLSAVRNRIFRTPPPVRFETAAVLLAFLSLDDLVGRLLPG